MYELLNKFLNGLAVYVTHIQNPSMMTVNDWIITILLIIEAILFFIFWWKWGEANNI